MRQQSRQAVTKKGVLRRLRDLDLGQGHDPRGRQGRRYPLKVLLNALMLGFLTAATALRKVEVLTASLSIEARQVSKVTGRISDTKLRDTALQLDHQELCAVLHKQVKAEHRRGRLSPYPLPFGVAALDGKCLAVLDDWGHPDVQVVRPEKHTPYGLARVHRAFLVSSEAQVCIHQRPIPGDTNEIGAVCSFTKELIEAYKRTSLFEVIIADAGNTSLAHGDLIHGADLGYVLAIKANCGDIHQEALRLLAHSPQKEAETNVCRREKGDKVTHSVWRAPINGYLKWGHARQLVRVQRVVEKSDGTVSTGNRYVVTNLTRGRLNGGGWLTLIRLYWRIENNGNWTADSVFGEDAKRTPFCRVPTAVFALSVLRMIALNIFAILRSMVRRDWDSNKISWAEVVHLAHIELASPIDAYRVRQDGI